MRGGCSMASKVFPIRASEEERQRWGAAAERAGLSFNAWARRALNDRAQLDESLVAQARNTPAAGPVSKWFEGR